MSDQKKDQRFQNGKQLAWGLTLITVGCLFLLDRLGYIDAFGFWTLFPAILALHGLIEIASSRKAVDIIKGCYNLVFAGWLYASMAHLWGLNFGNSWPILLIAIGTQYILTGLLVSRR